MSLARRILTGAVMLSLSSVSAAEESTARELLGLTTESCRAWAASGNPGLATDEVEITPTEIMFREHRIGSRFRQRLDATLVFELDVLDRSGRPTRFVGSLFNDFGDPLVMVVLDSDCDLQVARRIDYTINGRALGIVSLDDDLQPRGEPDWLNPPLEFVERISEIPLKQPADATPLRVAMVDSGVNYRLPEINRRLARDGDGNLVGYDFWDMDGLPFDAHPVDSGFFVQRHGTRTASLLLREAPGIELVPYRYPRPDMTRMRALIEHADRNGVGIVGMPLGSNRPEDWGAFSRSAREHPHMLFIVSAGNNGRDIDEHPVYPAALGLDNVLVVTSADDLVRPASRTNWGRITVDYLLPAERIEVTDFDGKTTLASGSSYAVARLAALTARLKMKQPRLRVAEIVTVLKKKYGTTAEAALAWVGSGYIADPLAGAPVKKTALMQLGSSPAGVQPRLPLEVLQLDPGWSREKIEAALATAFEILGQCGIVTGDVSVHAIESADYLRDLSIGGAHTLLEAAGGQYTTVVFARDTRTQAPYSAEAFGLANTGMRPWLANSVWLMAGVDDPGVALAHEIYHVLANSGGHVATTGNLMQAETRPDGTELTEDQCRRAMTNGIANGLLLE